LVRPRRADERSESTLGDLLYEESANGIAEHDWVRLVCAIAAGQQPALRELYERTHRIVFTLAMRICGNRETAEEVTIDVYHDVWRSSSRYDSSAGTVVGWIMIQTRSRAIDRLRFEQRKKRVDPHPDRPDDHTEETGPVDALDAAEQRLSLRRALSDLTSDEREAIETAFFAEQTYAETAAQLSVPLGTMKTRVRSALAKLRKALVGAGGPP
jgi:RNA polymerase sigma-70 factor (ECF subfamily)